MKTLTSGAGRPASRQAGVSADRQHALLELVSGSRRLAPAGQERSQRPGAVAPVVAAQLTLQRTEIEPPGDLSLIERSLHGTDREDVGEVEQGAAGCGHRDTPDGVDVTRGVQGARAMDLHPAVAAARLSRDRHVDPAAIGGAQLEQVRRGAVREDGTGTTGEHRGHVATIAGSISGGVSE